MTSGLSRIYLDQVSRTLGLAIYKMFIFFYHDPSMQIRGSFYVRLINEGHYVFQPPQNRLLGLIGRCVQRKKCNAGNVCKMNAVGNEKLSA